MVDDLKLKLEGKQEKNNTTKNIVKDLKSNLEDHIIPKREMEKKVRSVVRSISENVSLTPKEIAMGYKSTRKADSLNQWLITNDFPKGFQILCWNCNFAKGSSAVSFKCPHEK